LRTISDAYLSAVAIRSWLRNDQGYLRAHQPPLLAIWGKNDVVFVPAGAEAFKHDVPDAEIHLLDTGHLALETHAGKSRMPCETFSADA
jgi:pimeloyl-ACP methyl ester carboxylesterase